MLAAVKQILDSPRRTPARRVDAAAPAGVDAYATAWEAIPTDPSRYVLKKQYIKLIF